ncbi:MAG TPA: tRNA pseudouridine(55) synthase TruB [Candidatus Paceibacterota bacterium]
MIDGIFAINKPKGPTSNRVLQEIKKFTGAEKIGHAGTLDPLASGVLIIGIGQATKKLSDIVKDEKEYIAEIKLGEKSVTDDEEGIKQQLTIDRKPTIDEIENSIQGFVGKIEQIPPIYSAIKIQGKEAYKLARKGEFPEMEKRSVEIKEIKLLNYEWPILEIKAVTGPGTYIRSLARDIGESLGVGGYLANLKRTRVGKFTIDKALNPEDLISYAKK